MSSYVTRKTPGDTEWFRHDRFGMFIHWGLYAIPARGEWVRSFEEIPKEDYMKYFDEFDPVDYDPKKWAKAAKEAGMQYVVLTAKHHDGFCLFDSKYTDFKSTNTKCGRDLVAEFVEAVRGEGLKVGLYFTLLDWYHDDYPHYGDRNHPMRNNPAYKNDNRDFSRYVDYMHNQIREICTNYGKLDLLWFDFSYDDLNGEAWRATDLVNMVRELQPGVIIDNRLLDEGQRHRYRFTLGHEGGHDVFHSGYFSYNPDQVSIFDDELIAPMIQCRVDNGMTNKSDTRKWDDHDWMEWQANHLSAAVLMPKCSVDLLARSCKDKLKTPTSRAILIAKMSDCFDVSIQAATNRLKDLGYIKTNDTTDYSYASAIMDFAGVVGS